MSRYWRMCVLLLCGATVLSAQAQSVEEAMALYRGQRRILRSYGDQRKAEFSFRRTKLGGDCDSAVQVTRAEYDGRREKAIFLLETVGQLNVGGRLPRCDSYPREIQLTVEDILPEDDPDAVVAQIDNFLMTTEAYLAERGIGYETVSGADGKPALRLRPLRRAGQSGGDCWLVVYPHRSVAVSQEEETEGVVFDTTLGTDARFSEPKAINSPGPSGLRAGLLALEFWRCEPATEDGKRVPVKMQIRVRFVKR